MDGGVMSRARSMPRRHHILKSLASGVPVPVLAGDADPTLACCVAPISEIVGIHIDHQCDPIPFPRFTSHHVEAKPAGRRPIKIFGRHGVKLGGGTA